MTPDTPTIVIVDDAYEVRLLIKTRLRVSQQFTVVGTGADGADAVTLAQRHRPDLMLLDVSMPGMDGLEALPRVREASPSTRVVLYSGFEEQGLVETAHRLGAAAFIEKGAPVEALITRLREVAATGTSGGPLPEPASVRPGPPPVDQQVLDEHLERFREVFEEAAIGMATMTLTGRLVRVNRALARLVGREADDLVGVFYGDLVEDGEGQVASALEEIRVRPLDVVHLEHGLATGADDRLVRATLAPVRDSSGRPLYLFLQVQDVTAERAAIEELRRSEERFRLLVAAVEDYAIFMLDPGGQIISWNSGAQRIKGYLAEEIIGQHFRVFYPPEEQERRHPEFELREVVRVGHYEEEGWRVRRDGTRFWANVLITAVFTKDGEHLGFTKVTRDMSERRRLEQEREAAVRALAAANVELETANARLQQAAHDQAEFLAVTAHELRTPIGVLGGSAETLAKHWDQLDDEDRGELFEAMAGSTTRLRRLLGDLLTASRLQASALEMHPELVTVADVVAQAAARIARTHPHSDIRTDAEPTLAVRADPDRLAQALDNLLGNALRHGEPPVQVSARRREGSIEIRVTDAGPGVTEAMRGRLFERFATGRARGGGTGLGLFIVRELARAQGGDAFHDAEGTGAFVIRLPAAETGA